MSDNITIPIRCNKAADGLCIVIDPDIARQIVALSAPSRSCEACVHEPSCKEHGVCLTSECGEEYKAKEPFLGTAHQAQLEQARGGDAVQSNIITCLFALRRHGYTEEANILETDAYTLRAQVAALEKELANMTYSNNAHREMAERWRGAAVERDQLRSELAAERERREKAEAAKETHINDVVQWKKECRQREAERDADRAELTAERSRIVHLQATLDSHSRQLADMTTERDALKGRKVKLPKTIIAEDDSEIGRRRTKFTGHIATIEVLDRSEAIVAIRSVGVEVADE